MHKHQLQLAIQMLLNGLLSISLVTMKYVLTQYNIATDDFFSVTDTGFIFASRLKNFAHQGQIFVLLGSDDCLNSESM